MALFSPKVSEPDLDTYSLTPPIPNINVEDVTVATIEQYFPEVKSCLDVAEQICYLDGTIQSRTYYVYSFLTNPGKPNAYNIPGLGELHDIQMVPLGAFSPEYEAHNYFRVTTKVGDIEYFSTDSASVHGNFTKWERSFNSSLQEIIVKQKEINDLEWNKTAFNVPKAGEPFIKTIRAGKEIAAAIRADAPFITRLRSSFADPYIQVVDGVNTIIDINPTVMGKMVLLKKPYLDIVFPNPTNLTFINVDLYGVEYYRSVIPTNLDDEPDIIVHPPGTTQVDKYKPPGYSAARTDFWNNVPVQVKPPLPKPPIINPDTNKPYLNAFNQPIPGPPIIDPKTNKPFLDPVTGMPLQGPGIIDPKTNKLVMNPKTDLPVQGPAYVSPYTGKVVLNKEGQPISAGPPLVLASPSYIQRQNSTAAWVY